VSTPERRHAALALALVVPAPSIGAACAFFLWPGPIGQAAYTAGKVVLYGLPLFWRLFVDRERLSWSPPRKGGWLAGLGLGLALSAAILGFWLLLGRAWIDPAPLQAAAVDNGFDTPLRYLAICAWLMLVNSALEEYVFRWFLVTRWRALVSKRAAVVLAALCFTAHHVIVLKAFFPWLPTLLCSLGVLAGGLAWSWLYARHESIWPAWLSHLLVDAAIFVVGWFLLF
jgi:membrane protease YdiL (CAAX protease family)